jgi:hypothetical protein
MRALRSGRHDFLYYAGTAERRGSLAQSGLLLADYHLLASDIAQVQYPPTVVVADGYRGGDAINKAAAPDPAVDFARGVFDATR